MLTTAFVLGLSLSLSYLIGSFPTSYILGKTLKGVDIRQFGSGNVGATNVLRVVGKGPAILALAIDILKGVFVVTALSAWLFQFTEGLDYISYRAAMGFTVISGHIWPIFLKFKGGKGVATTIGVLAVITPAPLLISCIVWIIVFSLSKYVSLASLALAITLPISAAAIHSPFIVTAFSILICLILVYKHKANIHRLVRGEESKTKIF